MYTKNFKLIRHMTGGIREQYVISGIEGNSCEIGILNWCKDSKESAIIDGEYRNCIEFTNEQKELLLSGEIVPIVIDR